jgi:hydrogenase small subunit
MDHPPKTFQDQLNEAGVSRRTFLKFCGLMVGALALPLNYVNVVAKALAGASRLPLVWLEFQDCTGDSESFLRAGKTSDPLSIGTTDPNVTDLLLDFLSLDYHETLMAASGASARKSLDDTLAKYNGQFVCVVEGSIPTAQNGVFCTIGGRTAVSILQDVSSKALATIAMGACATDGGLAAAQPNPTQAVGVQTAAPNAPNLINLPGCPANVVNLVACLVHFLTFKQWPDLDGQNTRRPLFAYGDVIHENCERKYFFDTGKYVQAWGDAGHRAGWCLHKMGCKGPSTNSNCFKVKWNEGTNWPIGAGHGCIGCTRPGFWDREPVYQELNVG